MFVSHFLAIAALTVLGAQADKVYLFSTGDCSGSAFTYSDSDSSSYPNPQCQETYGYGSQFQSLLWAPDSFTNSDQLNLYSAGGCDGTVTTITADSIGGVDKCVGASGVAAYEVNTV